MQRDREQEFRRALKALDGAAAAVAAAVDAGLAVCVASQGKLEKTRLSLQLTGLEALFPAEAVFSAEAVARGKPHPDLFLHAASTMQVDPSRCVVVEDTPTGVSAAVAAGMRALGLAADSDEAALRAAGAEIMHTLDQLPTLLGLTR